MLESFGVRLKRLREEAGMSVVELARAAAVDRRHLDLIEMGRKEPGWCVVQRLAAALGASLGAFEGVIVMEKKSRKNSP